MNKSNVRLFLWIRNNIPLVSLILLAAIIHLIIILPSGSHYCFNDKCGDYYWGVQEHDGIWHIAVAETAFRSAPPVNPSYSGGYLSGYNILLDYVVFFVSKLGLTSFFIYFKVLPLVWFIIFTYTAIRFIEQFTKDKVAHYVFLFLSYFGTTFGFIVPLIINHNLNGVNAMMIMQPSLNLTNLQLAFSYVTMMWVIILMMESKKDSVKVIWISICLFFTWGLKFYTGFLTSLIIAIYYLFIAVQKKDFRYISWLLIFAISSICSIIFIYNPILDSRISGSTFFFQPLALLWPYIEDPGSFFYSSYWANAKYLYLNSSKMSLRFTIFEGVMVFFYVFFNLGMRVFGIFYFFKKKVKVMDISSSITILVGFLCSILLIQKGVWMNVVQFAYVSLFLLGVYTAIFIAKLKNRLTRNILIILVILTGIPYVYDSIKPYIKRGYNYVSDRELKALRVLKSSKKGIVYYPLFIKNAARRNEPVNELRKMSDNSYVSAYTGQQMYLQETGAILLSNDYKMRKGAMSIPDCKIVKDIDYVYYHIDSIDGFISKCVLRSKLFFKIYSDKGYTIYSKKS